MSNEAGFSLEPLFSESKEVFLGRRVRVVIKAMTEEEARQEFPYRPYLTEPDTFETPFFVAYTLEDAFAAGINGHLDKCTMCQAEMLKKYLHKNVCPDCDGRTELSGLDPRLAKKVYEKHEDELKWTPDNVLKIRI